MRLRQLPVLCSSLLLASPALLASPQVGVSDPAAAPLKAGIAALDEGRDADAVRHLSTALTHRPGSVEILQLLLRAASKHADARALWSHAWFAAASDERGRTKPSGDVRKLLAQDDSHLAAVAASRASAVEELVRFAGSRAKKGERDPGERLVGWWARRLAAELAEASPALEAQYRAQLDMALEVPEKVYGPIIKALEATFSSALSNQRTGEALRAARCLHGLAVQGGFKDLKGPRPAGMARLRQTAGSALGRARDQQRSKLGEAWTVGELEMFSDEEGEAFTREHSSFENPGVAVSPHGLYRIETECGYETLLGVARTVELHHRRLAKLFGEDPFAGKQGIVRVVAEANGLEAEGIPYWWAGGMQGGDTTTVRFACSTIEDLGGVITHELTHRFDGALYPGLPAWLVEGKAVWTGAAYADSTDERFIPNFAEFGTIEAAWVKDYGKLEKLSELIEGTIEEYRDNYIAGYALYVYLLSWEEDGVKPFAERLVAFMEGIQRGNKEPLEWFRKNFADGKGGRPEGLETFAKGFEEFVSGFYWQEPAPWTSRYTQDKRHSAARAFVYDEPTWVWSRKRAEPVFGESQARLAGELFAEVGRDKDAIAALTWALATDGRTPEVEAQLASLLTKNREKNGAWVLGQTLAFPEQPLRKAPFLGSLSRVRAHLEALETAARDYEQRGFGTAAAALAADHDRLAAWTGVERLRIAGPERANALHPMERAAQPLGARGWSEDGLTDYEEHRIEELWYSSDDGDLHIGRREARTGTGRVDRRAHRWHAFARSNEWLQPGVYRVKTRIQMTTSFVDGSVILGYTRRDRNIRLTFRAGDYLYAIGEKDEEPELESVRWYLHGLRERDYSLWANPAGNVDFGRPVLSFELELLVDGDRVDVSIDGELVGTYRTVDGTPIEGQVGFASSYGAYRVQRPVVQRLDRSRIADAGRAGSFTEILSAACSAVEPSSNGTVLWWVAAPELKEGKTFEPEVVLKRARKGALGLARVLEQEEVLQPLVIAVPEALGEEAIAELSNEIEAELGERIQVVTHGLDGRIPEGAEDSLDDGKHQLIFLDAHNSPRLVASVGGYIRLLSPRFLHLLAVFREVGRPERELPPIPEREGEGPEGAPPEIAD